MEYRIEHDSMGEVKVPADKYWAAQTERSHENFLIGVGIETMPREITHAFGILKKAAALANHKVKPERMDDKRVQAICAACDEVIAGKLNDHFPLVVWQTGSGTQSNMNANEVIANRGNEIAGEKLLHPNDHVNMSQSSNDTFPTAMHIAAVTIIREKLLPAMDGLIETFKRLEAENEGIVKTGRTHLQDATPIRFSQEISGWRNMIEKTRAMIEAALPGISELALGGTAVGTGLNCPREFGPVVARVVSELTGYPCCTSNLHQGWPKFVQNLWYATADNGLASLLFAPSQVTARVAGGIEGNLKEETAYPFEETVRYHVSFTDKKVKKVFFPFHLRIPGWCKQPVVKLNGKPLTVDAYPGTVTRINREWKEGDILSLELPMEVTVSRWYENSAVVERGPLVYALKMNEKWEKKAFESDKSDVYGKWYYEVTSDSPWNYALPARSFSPDRIKDAFTVEKSDITTPYPWNVENAPIRIKTKAMRLNGWTQVRGSAGPVPYYTQQGKDFGDEETIELIPYGCTTLRITEFPVR